MAVHGRRAKKDVAVRESRAARQRGGFHRGREQWLRGAGLLRGPFATSASAAATLPTGDQVHGAAEPRLRPWQRDPRAGEKGSGLRSLRHHRGGGGRGGRGRGTEGIDQV